MRLSKESWLPPSTSDSSSGQVVRHTWKLWIRHTVLSLKEETSNSAGHTQWERWAFCGVSIRQGWHLFELSFPHHLGVKIPSPIVHIICTGSILGGAYGLFPLLHFFPLPLWVVEGVWEDPSSRPPPGHQLQTRSRSQKSVFPHPLRVEQQ